MAFSERYTIEVPLGENELGTVWRGRVTDGGAKVAIVVLESDAPEATQTRFREHATKLLGVHNPHVVKAIEAGDDDEGAPFLVLELLEGESLGKRLTSGPALTVARAVEIVTQIGEGLAAVHAAGISHGDVEPGNVFLAKWGDAEIPKLIGFALNRADRRTSRDIAARLSLPSLGPQWAYAAPEQVRGETVASVAGDVYSLAAVLFATLGGQPPHVAPDAVTLLESIERGKPATLAAIKKELAPFSTIVDRALSTAPDKRPSDATAFLRGLKTAVAFAKAAHSLALPIGARSPIGTPIAAAPKAAAMPRPTGARAALGKPATGAKVSVGRPGPELAADGAGVPGAAATSASTTESIEDGSVDLESVRPPPPPPPRPRAAATDGADLGDIAVDTDDDAPAAAASAPGAIPAAATATPIEAAPAAAAVIAKPSTTPGAKPEPERTSDDAARATASDGAPSTAESPSTPTAGSETATETAGGKHDDKAEPAPVATPPVAAAAPPGAAPAKSGNATAPAQAADSPAPSAPTATAAAADTKKPEPAAAEDAKAREGASTAAERPSQRPPKKKRDSVRPKPASGWANADAPAGAASATGKSEAAPKPAKSEEGAPVALASAEPLPVAATRASARPAWILPAAGAAVLLAAALAFFALRGGDEPADRPRPIDEPDPGTVATGAPELDEAPDPSEEPAPAIEPGPPVAAPGEGDPEAPLAAEAVPVEGTGPDPSWELGASDEAPIAEEEPVVAAAAEPTPEPEPEPVVAPPTRTGSGSTTARGSSSGSSSGSSGGSARRTPRTPPAARERPTVVADPGF